MGLETTLSLSFYIFDYVVFCNGQSMLQREVSLMMSMSSFMRVLNLYC